MNIVIIEDEKLAADHLEKMIRKYDENIRIMAKLESVEESISWFSANPEPDLIFLDIHLEDGLSFSIFEQVDIRSAIIFTTAFDEYAIRAFKLKSIDYLLKPVMQNELNKAIEKYKDWKKSDVRAVDFDELMSLIANKEDKYTARFSVTVGSRLKSVPVDDIAYFYSEEGITFIVTKDKSRYTLDHSLDSVMAMLNPKAFFRINRQFIVSLKSIGNIHVYPKSRLKLELVPPAGTEVFVTIDKAVKFKEWLGS
jgi:DNA-binding LytR/AlgR family response regulator